MARTDSLQARIALAEARVSEAEQLKANVFIRAPFNGTVISKDAEVGESILPGGMGEASGRGSVVTIADLEHLEVDCDVKEDFISRIREAQTAEVRVDAVPDRKYQGRVRKIIPMGDRARSTIKVKVEILDADARLFPDMSGTVRFLSDDESGTGQPASHRRMFCPRAALQTTTDGALLSHVWIVDADNTAQRIVVTTGADREQQVEVTDGLSGQERVILDPPSSLRAGQKVRPVPE